MSLRAVEMITGVGFLYPWHFEGAVLFANTIGFVYGGVVQGPISLKDLN